MEQVKDKTMKDYLVYKLNTGSVLYAGNNAFKASQVFYTHKAGIKFKGKIQQSVFSYITAIQERLN